MIPAKVNLTIYQGTTFKYPFYWYSDTEVVKTVTGVTRSYPTLLTVVGHGIAVGERVPVTVLDVGDWINSASLSTDARIYATGVDTDTLSFAVDGTGQDAYTGTAGRLVYNSPMDLSAGWDARMQIRASVDDPTVIAEFLSTDNTITLDVNGKIEPVMIDTATDLLDFSSAVYHVEMVFLGNGEVTRVASGKVTLSKQVTRTP